MVFARVVDAAKMRGKGLEEVGLRIYGGAGLCQRLVPGEEAEHTSMRASARGRRMMSNYGMVFCLPSPFKGTMCV